MRAAVAMACLLASAPVAWAAGIESCEKIKDADDYNSCLASYGPAVGDRKFTRAPTAESEAAPPRSMERNKPKLKTAARKTVETPKQGPKRKANGRVRIEIFPGR